MNVTASYKYWQIGIRLLYFTIVGRNTTIILLCKLLEGIKDSSFQLFCKLYISSVITFLFSYPELVAYKHSKFLKTLLVGFKSKYYKHDINILEQKIEKWKSIVQNLYSEWSEINITLFELVSNWLSPDVLFKFHCLIQIEKNVEEKTLKYTI